MTTEHKIVLGIPSVDQKRADEAFQQRSSEVWENGLPYCDSIGIHVVTPTQPNYWVYRWKVIQFPFEESVNLAFKNLVIISFHLTDDGATTLKLVSGQEQYVIQFSVSLVSHVVLIKLSIENHSYQLSCLDLLVGFIFKLLRQERSPPTKNNRQKQLNPQITGDITHTPQVKHRHILPEQEFYKRARS